MRSTWCREMGIDVPSVMRTQRWNIIQCQWRGGGWRKTLLTTLYGLREFFPDEKREKYLLGRERSLCRGRRHEGP